MKIETLYETGDSVAIDGCQEKGAKAVVLAVMIRSKNISYEVAYWGNGSLHERWIEEWRLTPWEE